MNSTALGAINKTESGIMFKSNYPRAWCADSGYCKTNSWGEALKHQGKKSGKSTLDQVGESARENSKKVQRFFILSDSEIANKKSKLQFMRHATKALRWNGFVDGPNSAGSFYALSYYTLLWKTCFKCPSREIHSPSGLPQYCFIHEL